MNARGLVAGVLALGACSSNPLVTLQPQLLCPAAVRCDVVEWQVGIRPGSYIGGSHGGCHCVEGRYYKSGSD
jgi:hypothetical protein